jgi:hypothetical protein
VELHGWNPVTSSWHGPDELDAGLVGRQALVPMLRDFAGAWFGRLRAQTPGGLEVVFWATARDLEDCGVATLDLEGLRGGPLQSMLIAPPQRRRRARADLAFEFVAFLRFLQGPESAGTELAIHEYLEQALATADASRTLVFSVESRPVEEETRIALCEQADRLALSMIASMAERDSVRSGALRRA